MRDRSSSTRARWWRLGAWVLLGGCTAGTPVGEGPDKTSEGTDVTDATDVTDDTDTTGDTDVTGDTDTATPVDTDVTDTDTDTGTPDTDTQTSPSICGDGVIEGDEACDDGVDNDDTAACTSDCRIATCGDGLVWDGTEGCDEGTANADDAACTLSCQPATCGDGLVWDGTEGCDEGTANADNAACTLSCQPATCGDSLVWEGVEDCDDGNDLSHDGCNPECLRTTEIGLGEADAELVGETNGDRAGLGVASAGDVNGDGYGDLIIGADGDGEGGYNAGAAYLVLGPVTGTLDLSSADAKLLGPAPSALTGIGVASAGDVDGDGNGDLIVGAYGYTEGSLYQGAAYLVRGPVTGTLSLTSADARIVGSPGDYLGVEVSGAGDVDGDGYDDILLGATLNDQGGGDAGIVYLFRGPVDGDLDAADADGALLGATLNDEAGWSASGAGDVDGDGLADILVGAIYAEALGRTQPGIAYLVYGGVSGLQSLSGSDASLVGEHSYDRVGSSSSGAGDVDGDGLDDVLVGTDSNDDGGNDAGAAYLVSGAPAGIVDLANADAKLVGAAAGDQAGASVASAGDIDGDGFADILIGAPRHDAAGVDAGAAYLLCGPVTGTIDLPDADAVFLGESAYDGAGGRVAGAGDVDGDGLPDFVIAAHDHDEGGFSSGSVYLLTGVP